MSIVSKIAIISTLPFAIILVTDIFYNYAMVGLKGKSVILDLMYDHNIYLVFVAVFSILFYLIVLKEQKYIKENQSEVLNKVYPLLYTTSIPLVVMVVFTLFNPITEYFKDVLSYLVFMFSMLLFSFVEILMFIGIYSKVSSSQSSRSVFLRTVLILLGAVFFSNFIHLVIFEKLGFSDDCSLVICFKVNDVNIVLTLVLTYLLYAIMFWMHLDIFFGIVRFMFAVLAFFINAIILYYIPKWLPLDWALTFLTFSYIFYIKEMIKMACTKQSEIMLNHESLWRL